MTKNHLHSDKEKLLKHYQEGYAKGRDDALRGLRMKILQKTIRMRSGYLEEWERGYLDGYLAVNN